MNIRIRPIYLFPLLFVLLGLPAVATAQKKTVVEKVLVTQKSKTLRDGSQYKGDMMLMRPHGRGKLTYTDGTVYQGYFAYGKRHGQGTMTYKNGEK